MASEYLLILRYPYFKNTLKIILQNVGKRFNSNWVFRNLSYQFITGNHYAVIGANGSGKSTLLKAISGYLSPTEGKIDYSIEGIPLLIENVFPHVAIASTWLDLPGYYTLSELIAFQMNFKASDRKISVDEFLAIVNLPGKEKHLSAFSSGMKQKVKLGLALLSSASVLLLDEPLSALDSKGVGWYKEMISNYANNRMVIVFSNNREEEYGFTDKIVSLK